MLGIYRRHEKHCARRGERRRYRGCRCPVWVDGRLNGERIHKSLDTRDSQKAQRIVREWEANGQRNNDFEAAKPIAVEDAWKSFLADLQSRNLRISTIRKHKLLSRHMQEFALRRGIRFLKEFDLAALRDRIAYGCLAAVPTLKLRLRPKMSRIPLFRRDLWRRECRPPMSLVRTI